jgi:hypothetical protein
MRGFVGSRKFLVLILIAAAVLALAFSCTRALTEEEAEASLRRTAIQYGSYTKTGCSYEFKSLEVEGGVLAYARTSECGERGHYEYSYRVSLAELEPSGVSVKVDMEGSPRLYAPCMPEANCVEITERYRDQRGEGTKQYFHKLVMLGFTGEIPERELEALGETFARLLELHARR